MKTCMKDFVLLFALGSLAPAGVFAQQPAGNSATTPASTQATSPASTPPTAPASTSTPSLGEIARKLKAQKAKDHQPAWVVTNDNIPKEGNGVTVAPGGKASADSSEGSGTGAKGHDAEYYRKQQSKLQDQLDTDKRELDVLQQKLGQNNMQYYSDPNKTLQQEYSRDDINKLNAEIDAKKQKVADDEKALEDLREQLRQEGGDPGWLR
jgi:hypothetical protein